jgi:hypothetical protein
MSVSQGRDNRAAMLRLAGAATLQHRAGVLRPLGGPRRFFNAADLAFDQRGGERSAIGSLEAGLRASAPQLPSSPAGVSLSLNPAYVLRSLKTS